MSPSALALHKELDALLGGLLPPGTRAALINYPNHNNVGDPALYLGTLRTLMRLGVEVTYRCEHATYSRASLAEELRRGTDVILINGGGNLGDQYQQQQGREQVLADFPGTRTIQLPQSIWFAREASLNRFAALVAAHNDLTLLLRDRASMDFAARRLRAKAVLCPDMALGLGKMPRPTAASQGILWLKRRDRESTTPELEATSVGGVRPVDWLDAPPADALGGADGLELLRTNGDLAQRIASGQAEAWRPLAETFEPLARRRLDFGRRLLSRGAVVVSDRLHGILLAMLMDIPAVAVDNSYGKVSSFIKTWLWDVPGVTLAPDHAAALTAARRQLE